MSSGKHRHQKVVKKDNGDGDGFFSQWVKKLFGSKGDAGKITLGLGVSALGTVGAYYYLNSKYPLPALFGSPTPVAIVPEVTNSANIAIPAAILAGAVATTAGAATYFGQWINQEYRKIKEGIANLEYDKKVVADQYRQFDSIVGDGVKMEKMRVNVQHEMARTMVHRLDEDRRVFDSQMHEQFEAGMNVNKKRMNAIELTERELRREIARFDAERRRVRDFERSLEEERKRLTTLEVQLKNEDNRRRATYSLFEKTILETSKLNTESSAAEVSRISKRNNTLSQRLSRRDGTIKALEAEVEKQRREFLDGREDLTSRELQLEARQAELNDYIRKWEESASGIEQFKTQESRALELIDLNIQKEEIGRRERMLDTERKTFERDEQLRDAALSELDRKMHLIKLTEAELNAREKALESLILQHSAVTLESRRASGGGGRGSSSTNSSPSKQQ